MATTGSIIKKSAGLLIAAALLYLIVPAGYKAYQNYNGVCLAEGRVLTDDEKIRMAITSVNLKPLVYVTSTQSYEQYLPYDSTSEFLKNNPNCCHYRWGQTSSLPGTTWQNLIGGINTGYVKVSFTARYKNQQSEAGSTFVLLAAMIDNCGNIHDNWQSIESGEQ